MSKNEIKRHIESLCSHLTFDWNGKECGVDPLSATEYEMWCGENLVSVKSIEEVMTIPFFDGKSLEEIMDIIEKVDM